MSEPIPQHPGKAVFLSYASQDSEPARRIADALRAAGVEVWFDQSELVGGDAWDQKIRRQIKDCSLLIPIISANTQARTEGYFRLEWRLADQRTHLMAKGRPFLLPVVIDDTRDADAHVPDSFTEVQWTRLRQGYGGQALDDARVAALCARVARLLAGQGAAPAAERPVQPGDERPVARKFNPVWLFLLIPGAILLIATGGMMIKRYQDAGSAGSASRSTAPVSETQDLVTKARALLDDDPLMTRANVELAEQLSLQAIAKDPTGGEAYAVAAWTNFRFIEGNYEDTVQRRADLRRYAEKARLLAPDSVNAELAITGVLLATDNRAEATLRLRALADRAPDNLTVLRAFAGAAPWGNGVNWGDDKNSDPAALDRLRAHSPLGRSYADSFLANQHWAKGEYVEADRVLDSIFAAGQPVRLSYLLRLLVLTYGWGDMPAARDYIANLPSKLLLEDVFITHVTKVFLYSGEHDRALATLDRTQREMLQEAKIRIPTGILRGEVLAAGGRPSAAAIQWRSALAVVDKWLGEDPADAFLHLQRAHLLIRLDDRKGAAAEFALAMEIFNPPSGSVPWGWGYDYFALAGDFENAIPRIDRLIARDNGRWPNDYNNLRFDPAFAGLRKDTRVQAIMARGAQWLAEMKSGAEAPVPAVVAAASDSKSIAVLPFANMSEDKENAFFADGVQEDILTNLSNIHELRVVSRTSVMGYRGTTKTLPQIAQELGVTYILEGSVRRAGNKVRVTGQLIRAATDEHIWAKSYDRDLTDIFAIQSEVAQEIATSLQAVISPQEKSLIEQRPTDNIAAYDAYTKARQILSAGAQQNFNDLVPLLKTAVLLDPKFAQAWAELGSVYARRYFDYWERTQEVLDNAKQAIDTAVALAPDDPVVIQKLGDYYYYYGLRDYPRAARQYRLLAEQYPNYAPAQASLAFIDRRMGRWGEALEGLRRAVRLEPRNLRFSSALVETLTDLRRYEEAEALQREVIAQGGGGPYQKVLLAINAFEARGSTEAFDALADEFAADPKQAQFVPVVRYMVSRMRGDLETFSEAAGQIREMRGPERFPWEEECNYAMALNIHGDKEQAKALMEKRIGEERDKVEKQPLPREWTTLAVAYAVLDNKAEALRCAQAAVDLVPEAADATEGVIYTARRAMVLAWFGEKDEALAEVKRLLGVPGGLKVEELRRDPFWKPLQGDPRFQALLDDPKNNEPLL